MRVLILALITLFQVSNVMAADKTLSDFPFWRATAGWWRAENTYMDRDLNYNIRSYNSVIHVEVDGRTFRETEIKSYAPSKLAVGAGRGKTTADEGVEVVTVSTGTLIDDAGTVRLDDGEGTEIRVLTPDTAVRVTPNPRTQVDTYRMYIMLPVPDKRYRTNFGIVSDTTGGGAANAAPDAKFGDLRGFSVFREDRITDGNWQSWRDQFRAKNKVAAVSENGAVTRLDGK